ncbi:MAG: Holliday junction resolvase RuvX [FCB group bacterium]|nr:Holliday junction resolvase RuvX [FCB group bacterium]
MENQRFLGFDPGGRRFGVAVSDPGGLIARPVKTLIVTGRDDALRQVMELIVEYEPVGIVIGKPLGLAGGSSEMSKEVDKFADKLRKLCSIPIFLEDERLSSRQAEAVLHAHGKKIKGNKAKIDRISAAIILQSFLDRRGLHSGDQS